jgi:hypothetical protein
MRTRTILAFTIILLASINCFGQGLVMPRRRPKPVEPATTQPPVTEQTTPASSPLPAALPVTAIKINARIDGQVATVRVEHLFRNDSDDVLEGTYYFPVPEGATLLEFAVYDGDERRVGRIKEKAEARAAYTAATAQGEDPAILEMTKRGWFQSHVYPIAPHADKRIEIIYTQLLADKDGVVTLDYPLGRGYKKLKVPVSRVEIDVDLRAEVAIKNFFSPTHPLDMQYDGDRHATGKVVTAGGDRAENFQLTYSLSDQEISASLITYRKKGEDGYFLLMLSPKIDFDRKRISAKDVLFVIDISGSMSGDKLKQAKEALRFGITKTLNEADTFNIVAFESSVHPMSPGLIPATRANLDQALNFIDKLEATGGTHITGALVTALGMLQRGARPNNVVFVTDGQGDEPPEQTLAKVSAANTIKARLFTFGVGTDVNRIFLEQLAMQNRGALSNITDQSQVSRTLSTFFAKVSEPVLADLRVDFGPVAADRMHPAELPDLYTKSQIRIFGRYHNQEDLENVTVSLTGRMSEQAQRFDFSGLHFPLFTTDKDALPKLWATERVNALLAEIRTSGERPELKQEVIELAREFNLVTPYTSMYVPTTAEIQREKETEQKVTAGVDITLKVIEKGKQQVTVTGDQSFERLQLLADLQKAPVSSGPGSGGGTGTGDAVLIQSNSSSLSFSVDGASIRNLPLNGRNFVQLATLSPNTASPAPNAVVDAQGAVIPNATVTIKDQNTGAARTVTTDATGSYSVAGLPPGTYQVQVQAPGFAATTVSNVVVQPGQNTGAGVTLNAGGTTETVTVTSVAAALDTSTTHISASQNSNLLKELPSLAPVDSLARLAPGVIAGATNQSPHSSASANRSSEFQLRINGGQPLANEFTIDGHTNSGIDGMPVIAIRSLDAIEMLHVMTTRGAGDVSLTGAAAINLITRSGTNYYHGSVFDYHLDNRLDALSPLERRSGLENTPLMRSDLFGGTLGGPIIRDRLFFFASFAREHETARRFIDSTAALLTPTARGLAELSQRFVDSSTVNDLLTRGPLALAIGEPRITRTFIIPMLGVPIEFGEVIRKIPSRTIGYEAGARMNYEITNRDRLQLSYWHNTRGEENTISRLAAGYAGDREANAQLGGVRWTRLLSPHSTNELALAFNRSNLSMTPSRDLINPDQPLNQSPGVIVGYRGLSYGANPLLVAAHGATLFTVSDTLNKNVGRHTVKLGGQLGARLTRMDYLPGAGGQFTYASFDDFVLDQPASLAVAIGDARSRFTEWHGHVFMDDAWRMRSNLTLSLGFSYEKANQPINQLFDRIRRREADPARALFDSGLHVTTIDRDNNNLAPRVGFAYTPRFRLFGKNWFGYDKTVIRGGVSLSYDQTAYRPLADVAASAPNVLLGVLTPSNSPATFPNVPDAAGLRALLGPSPLAYARTELAQGFHTPSNLVWHLETSRDFEDQLTVAVAYIGARGAGLIRAVDGNPFSTNATGPLRIYESSGHSIYHALEVRAELRLTNRLTGGVTYTLSKLIDDMPDNAASLGGVGNPASLAASSLPVFAQNPFDTSRGERALSSLDRRHNLTANFVWSLPLHRGQRGIAGGLLSGWKASGIVEVASGSPYTPLQYGGHSTALFAAIFADRLGSIRPFNSNADAPVDAVAFSNAANRCFNFFANADGSPFISPTGFIIADRSGFHAGSPMTARFIYNDYLVEQGLRARGLAPDALGKTFAAGRPFGDVGRNTLVSPQLKNVNFALMKNTKLGEKVTLQLRSEFFNLFNHPNHARPDAIVENAGGYGFADLGETDATPRRIRIALKLMF